MKHSILIGHNNKFEITHIHLEIKDPFKWTKNDLKVNFQLKFVIGQDKCNKELFNWPCKINKRDHKSGINLINRK